MIDFRYHIYSLASIFLALAVGIVIGTSFAKGTPVTKKAQITLQRYENSIRVLKRQIERSTEESSIKDEMAKNDEDFCRAILPIVIKNKLAWRNVAIVQTGNYDDLAGSVKHALEIAGARVTSTTEISRDFDFNDYEKVSQALTECGVTPPSDKKQARDKLFAIIAHSLYATDTGNQIPKLEEAGVGTFTGDYSRFNKLVVLVGGSTLNSKPTTQSIDVQLISQLEKLTATVVGCEEMNAEKSYIPAWHKMGIATVDNANTAMGQLAMIYALNGEVANFGVKDTATKMIPQTLEIQ